MSNYETTTLNDAYPDFSATNSMANPWDYLQFVDLNTGTPYVGSTGFHLSTAGTAATYEFEVNVNYKRWMGVEISSRASGGIKTTITFTDNR